MDDPEIPFHFANVEPSRWPSMEKRAMYAAFEKTVIDLYEQKALTLDLLDHIAGQYRLIGMDSAGSHSLRTQDGKDLYQICISLVDPIFWRDAHGGNEDYEEHWEQELKKWEEIVHQRWGWQAYGIVLPPAHITATISSGHS